MVDGQALQIAKEEAAHPKKGSSGGERREETDPAHHVPTPALADMDIDELLRTPSFIADINLVCQQRHRSFGPSETYKTWQDLRQDVEYRFIESLPKYREEATVKTFLDRIAEHLCIDAKRRQEAAKRKHIEVVLELAHLANLRGTSAEEQYLQILLHECWSSLDEVERKVFYGYRVEGRSLSEIARAEGFSAQTALNIMARVQTKLEKLLS